MRDVPKLEDPDDREDPWKTVGTFIVLMLIVAALLYVYTSAQH
jgi:hypothetical protein